MENRLELEVDEAPSKFKRICVFCGSSSGNNPTYHLAAVRLGKLLVFYFIFYKYF